MSQVIAVKNSTISVLFIAPLPPPTTGQSLAADVLFRSLDSRFVVHSVNLSKQSFRQGLSSVDRIRQVFSILLDVFKLRNRTRIIYFTISESVAGSLKDLFIYFIFLHRLDRMVVHLHGGAGMKQILSSKHPLLRLMHSFFLRRIGSIVVLGDRLKGIYQEIVPPARLHSVPNFAQDEFFVSSTLIEEKFSNPSPLRILFLSNLLPGKGHIELLTALSLLPQEIQRQLHVDFAGGYESIEDEARFQQQVMESQFVNIKVHGVVHGELKRKLLSDAHVFCLPTYYPYEGQPISILEAFASGCAVITTDHSGIFDTFTPGVNGIEVSTRSVSSLADAIQRAVEHKDELLVYAKNNLEHARQNYRVSTHVAALERVIFSVG